MTLAPARKWIPRSVVGNEQSTKGRKHPATHHRCPRHPALIGPWSCRVGDGWAGPSCHNDETSETNGHLQDSKHQAPGWLGCPAKFVVAGRAECMESRRRGVRSRVRVRLASLPVARVHLGGHPAQLPKASRPPAPSVTNSPIHPFTKLDPSESGLAAVHPARCTSASGPGGYLAITVRDRHSFTIVLQTPRPR